MPDRLFSNSKLAALYNLFSPSEPREDFRFYLPMIMEAESVLDVGCGTGSLLIKSREAGHSGRLCGLDPAAGMLEQARKRSDIEWKHGDLSSVTWDREFDLVVMSGHAFQVFLSDEEILNSLKAICSMLKDGGHFAFETRNPQDRAWERWGVEYGVEAIDSDGSVVTKLNGLLKGNSCVSLTHSRVLAGRRQREVKASCGLLTLTRSHRFCPKLAWRSNSSTAIGTGLRSQRRARR